MGVTIESKRSFSSTSKLAVTKSNMKFIMIMTLFVAASAVTVDRREKLSSIDSKKHGKRGVFGFGYGYQHEQGGHIYGPPPAEPAPIYETGNPPEHGYPVHSEQAQSPIFLQPVAPTVPVQQPVPVLQPVTIPHPIPVPQAVPHPYPVAVPVIQTVTKHIAVDRPVPVAVDRPVPVAVPVPKPYPVHIEKIVHVPVEKIVHVPVHVAVPKPFPVTVEKYINVDRPYPVHVAVPVHVPKPYPVPVAIHTQYKAIHGW